MKTPAKIKQLLQRIREMLATGRFLDTAHAAERQSQRRITRPEILYVLNHGWHEKRKDVFDFELVASFRYHKTPGD